MTMPPPTYPSICCCCEPFSDSFASSGSSQTPLDEYVPVGLSEPKWEIIVGNWFQDQTGDWAEIADDDAVALRTGTSVSGSDCCLTTVVRGCGNEMRAILDWIDSDNYLYAQVILRAQGVDSASAPARTKDPDDLWDCVALNNFVKYNNIGFAFLDPTNSPTFVEDVGDCEQIDFSCDDPELAYYGDGTTGLGASSTNGDWTTTRDGYIGCFGNGTGGDHVSFRLDFQTPVSGVGALFSYGDSVNEHEITLHILGASGTLDSWALTGADKIANAAGNDGEFRGFQRAAADIIAMVVEIGDSSDPILVMDDLRYTRGTNDRGYLQIWKVVGGTHTKLSEVDFDAHTPSPAYSNCVAVRQGTLQFGWCAGSETLWTKFDNGTNQAETTAAWTVPLSGRVGIGTGTLEMLAIFHDVTFTCACCADHPSGA